MGPEDQNVDRLSTLPPEVKKQVCTLLNDSGLYNLYKTAKYWEPVIADNNKSANEKSPKFFDNFRKLLGYVTTGDWVEAEAIYTLEPALINCRGTIYQPNRIYDDKGHVVSDIPIEQNSGRYKHVNCTPYEILLAHEAYEEAEKMGKHMTPAEKQAQFMRVFPEGEIKKYIWDATAGEYKTWDLEHAKGLLTKLFDAVINDDTINSDDRMNATTQVALKALQDYVNPALYNSMGLVFDARLYALALKIYDEKYSSFTKDNQCEQRSFWCRRVEESLASLLGMGYLPQHAQGIGNNYDRAKGCRLVGDDGSSYLSFRRQADSVDTCLSVPGFHFFVGYFGSAHACGAARPRWGGDWGRSPFSKIMSSKSESRDRLMQQVSRRKKSTCLVL